MNPMINQNATPYEKDTLMNMDFSNTKKNLSQMTAEWKNPQSFENSQFQIINFSKDLSDGEDTPKCEGEDFDMQQENIEDFNLDMDCNHNRSLFEQDLTPKKMAKPNNRKRDRCRDKFNNQNPVQPSKKIKFCENMEKITGISAEGKVDQKNESKPYQSKISNQKNKASTPKKSESKLKRRCEKIITKIESSDQIKEPIHQRCENSLNNVLPSLRLRNKENKVEECKGCTCK